MERLRKKVLNLGHRKHRIRAKITGTTARPRLTISISNMHVSAQIIDDSKHSSLVSATTVGNKLATGTMTQKAELIGKEIASKAIKNKIKRVVFDRNGKRYHGRIKALADAARTEGLEF